MDDYGLLRVGGREKHSLLVYDTRHPLTVHAKHSLSGLLVSAEHLRLLHAGPSLLIASLYSQFHIVLDRTLIRSVTPNSGRLPNNGQESVHQPYFPLLQYKTNLPRADITLLQTTASYACTSKQRSIQFYLY